MHRHTQSGIGIEVERETHRREWDRAAPVEHQLEAREHARVSAKAIALRSALEREGKRQIREVGAR